MSVLKVSSNYAPLRLIDELDQPAHLVLLYNSPEYGDLVKYKFIEKGLKKGEHSIVLTHHDVNTVKDEMESQDINVQKYLKENLLHIFQIEDVSNHPNGLEKGFNELIEKITKNSKPPYRILGTAIPNVKTRDGMEAELLIERLVHSNFSKFRCSMMCVYNVSEIEKTHQSEWLTELIKNHHHVIYASEPNKSAVFETALLDPE